MSRIPEETIREIRDRIDIVEFIGRYVELRKAGRDFKACCLFHSEKTPSFNVSPSRQMFHCFGCQAGGDVVGFLMQHENLTFPEAVRTLASECGVEIPESGGEDRGVSERAFAANEVAQALYTRALSSPEAAAARQYLDSRGLDADSIERFGVGYSPNRWDAVTQALNDKRIPLQDAVLAGLVGERESGGYYDRMRDRIIFPIYDVRRRIIGFGGRALGDQEPKYLNTPESAVFHKRKAVYGFPSALEAIRRSGRVIVCEGYFDRIALYRAGLGEAVATCGTSLTPEHARELRRRARQVVLLFDGDKAGRKAAERALEVLLPEGLRVLTATLPDGEDPDTLLVSRGGEALAELVDAAQDALEVVIRDASAIGSSPALQADAVAAVAPIIALVTDPVERVAWARKLSMATDTNAAAVESVVRSAARSGGSVDPEIVGEKLGNAAVRRHSVQDRHIRLLATVFFHHPDLAQGHSPELLESLLPEGVWKALVLELNAAAQAGCIDAKGVLDSFQLEDRLNPDQQALIREVSLDDAFLQGDSSPARICEDLIGWFSKQQRKSESRSVTRQMGDASEDLQKLLLEKQKLLDLRRAELRAQSEQRR